MEAAVEKVLVDGLRTPTYTPKGVKNRHRRNGGRGRRGDLGIRL